MSDYPFKGRVDNIQGNGEKVNTFILGINSYEFKSHFPDKPKVFSLIGQSVKFLI